jgi:hypothetical protein
MIILLSQLVTGVYTVNCTLYYSYFFELLSRLRRYRSQDYSRTARCMRADSTADSPRALAGVAVLLTLYALDFHALMTGMGKSWFCILLQKPRSGLFCALGGVGNIDSLVETRASNLRRFRSDMTLLCIWCYVWVVYLPYKVVKRKLYNIPYAWSSIKSNCN